MSIGSKGTDGFACVLICPGEVAPRADVILILLLFAGLARPLNGSWIWLGCRFGDLRPLNEVCKRSMEEFSLLSRSLNSVSGESMFSLPSVIVIRVSLIFGRMIRLRFSSVGSMSVLARSTLRPSGVLHSRFFRLSFKCWFCGDRGVGKLSSSVDFRRYSSARILFLKGG